MSIPSGVYRIDVAGRIYIGSAKNIKYRWNAHIRQLEEEWHHNKRLQRLFNKYGKDSLVFSVIEYCASETLLETEQYYLDGFLAKYGDRIVINGTKIVNSPTAGTRLSDEHKRKIGESNKVFYSTDEGKEILDSIRKLRKSRRGIKRPESFKAKMREYAKTFKDNKERSEKIRASKVGRRPTEETRKKQSNAKLGKRLTSEQRAERSSKMFGKLYVLIGPDGTVYENVTNLALFASEHGLNGKCLANLASGKGIQHKGFRVIKVENTKGNGD